MGRVGITRLRTMLGQRWVGVVGTAFVIVVGIFIVVRTVDTDRVVEAIRLADLGLLAAAAGIYTLSWPLRGRRYDEILGEMDQRCGFGFLTAAVFVSQMVNLVVPARAGDGFRAYLLKSRRSVPYTTGAASLTVERLFDLLALVLLGTVSGMWLLATGRTFAPDQTGQFLVGAGGVGSVAVVLAIVMLFGARGQWQLTSRIRARVDRTRLSWLVESLVQFGGDLRVVVRTPNALASVGVQTLAIWVLDVLTAVLVLWAVAGTGGESVLGLLMG
ncbi:MAG: lysylphosphatidylglycerol synthase transmembrane domain-containing protein, partial [Halovenus sp.]